MEYWKKDLLDISALLYSSLSFVTPVLHQFSHLKFYFEIPEN
jgi:hypothetical protein